MTQQVDATTEQRLARQLERLKGTEKSEIRMIEADRHRFRIKYRKRDFPKVSLTTSTPVKESKFNDPTIVDGDHRQTNNTTSQQPVKKFEEQDYEAIRSLIFTGDKVDLDKILCLHLLTVHVIDIDEAELLPLISQKNGQSRVVVAAKESENNPNDILPCYVVEIQRDESLQFHPRSTAQQQEEEEEEEEEEEVLQQPEGQLRYPAVNLAVPATTAEGAFQSPRAMPAPSAAGKMPIVSSPLLYNNLLESHASRRGNPRGSPSLEHLLKYVHTGQVLDKSDEKLAAQQKLQRAESSAAHRGTLLYKRARLCKREKYFICTEAPKLPANQCRQILICFNIQLKNFVQTLVEVLRNVNLEKTNVLLDMLKSSQVVTAKLSEMKDFIDSLQDFSFVSLPESFACVPGYAIVDERSQDGNKISKQPVAETLILESDALAFSNLLDDMRQSISDFLKKSSTTSSSVENLLDDVSMTSVPSQLSTVNQKSSRMSFSVRKSVEKIEPINESSTKSYEAIQQEFNEAASARLAKKNNSYTDPDRVILRRMTNSQRILVGQMCAALKTKKINNEGRAKEKIPLPALLKPVLSRESIKYLTQGTVYAKDNSVDESKVESKTLIPSLCIDLTDFILTKIYHEMIELESRSQLQHFMNDVV